MVQLKLQQFEGPFDLLLSLIDQRELEITTVSLSEVTEQYLTYFDTLEEDRADVMADFLVVASKLLLLKARSLLPQFLPDEDDGPGLEEQLKMYKIYVEASNHIHTYWESDMRSFFREEPTKKVEEFVPPINATGDKLHASMVQLIDRLKPHKPLPKVHIDKTVSLKQKVQQMRELLKRSKRLSFDKMLSSPESRSEIIVGFLAILELVKQSSVQLTQDTVYGEIMVESM